MLSSEINPGYNNIKKRCSGESKLSIVIRTTSVEFTRSPEGYQAIGNNIFIDNFPYLIFFAHMPDNPNLKESVMWTRKLILQMINREIAKLSSQSNSYGQKETEIKLRLLKESEKKIMNAARSI